MIERPGRIRHIYKVTFVDEPGKKDYQVGGYIVDMYHLPETCEPYRVWIFPRDGVQGTWRIVAKYLGEYEEMKHLLEEEKSS